MRAVHRGPIAVRAYVAPATERRRSRAPLDGSGLVLVLDCETATDASQRLLFGSYRVFKGDKLRQEGLIHADDLDVVDMETLRTFVASRADDRGGRLRLISRTQFVNEVLWQIGYVGHGLIVGFNLAFDLSRLAVGHTRAKQGGFSLQLWESRADDGTVWRHLWRPNVTVKHIGSKRQFISFASPARVDSRNRVPGGHYRGRFLDLRMAAFALTDRSHSLASAAAEFGLNVGKSVPERHGFVTPEYIEYNRQDVRTTAALYRALRDEWATHPLEVPLEQLYSGASVGKAYLDAMGIRPPREKARAISANVLGYHMTAYFGGRTECRIRRVPLPVRYVDVTSMYPTVFALLGLWRYVTAAGLSSVDVTAEAREMLAGLDREALHDPARWTQLACIVCRVRPDGHLLPVRARYGAEESGAWTIGLNELQSSQDVWYTLADLLACKLLTGTAPEVLEAIQVVPEGLQQGLTPVQLGGVILIDPAIDDFFRVVIEARQRIKRGSNRPEAERRRLDRFLKVLANSTSYGVFAEFRLGDPAAGGVPVTAFGLAELHARVQAPEEPGRFLFPPLAATITGAARLLLALIEADLAAISGSYVGCDTDALLIVASSEGGLVPCPGGHLRLADGRSAVLALSDHQVDELITGIDPLNPYARDAVPSLIKLEDENFSLDGSGQCIELRGLQLSSKRYALYEVRGDEVVLRKASEHGFGLYRSPVQRGEDRWHEQVWRRYVAEAEGFGTTPMPEWFNRPAVSQLPVTSPALLAPFRRVNEGKSYAAQVKPFNFLLIGHSDPLAPLPAGLAHGAVTPGGAVRFRARPIPPPALG